MRKENYSCGETTEVCPNTTLGYLNPVYNVASRQQLNYRNIGEKRKKERKKPTKIKPKPWKKHLSSVCSQVLGPSNFALPLHKMKQVIATFSPCLWANWTKNLLFTQLQ